MLMQLKPICFSLYEELGQWVSLQEREERQEHPISLELRLNSRTELPVLVEHLLTPY